MAQSANLKRRLQAVSTTRQITKAMQLVATSRLRRAEAAVSAPQAYAGAAAAIVADLATRPAAALHPYFRATANESTLIVIVASDRGLAGPYNNNLIKALASTMQARSTSSYSLICVGWRAATHLARFSGFNQRAVYPIGESAAITSLVAPIAAQIDQLYLAGSVDNVQLLYTRFESAARQTIVQTQLLPQPLQAGLSTAGEVETDFVPTLEAATRLLIRAQLSQAIADGRASEQAARVLAMTAATDNATDLKYDLTLAYNTARQAAITTAIAEISAGVAAAAG